jgi:hypothetical protein
MLKRTMDAAFLNGVANHPEVRPHLGGSGELQLDGILSDPGNIGLQCDHGGFVIHRLEPGVYECHSMFLPEGRGGNAAGAMAETLHYLFTATDCCEALTKVPDGNAAALGAARALGFTKAFRLENGWPNPDGTFSGVDCWRLPIWKWIEKDGDAEKAGAWFHERLEELTREAGKTIPVHYEEPAHNRAAGAAVLMYRAGNPVKATNIYNSWARFAGFPQVKLLSINPVILDMDQVVIGVSGDNMEVLKCR